MVSQFWISKGTKRNQNYFREGLFEFFYDNNACCRLILEADDQAIHHWTYEKTPLLYAENFLLLKTQLSLPCRSFLFSSREWVGVTKYNIAAACDYITFSRNLINQASTMLYLCMTFMQWGNCSCGIPILVLFLSQIYQN